VDMWIKDKKMVLKTSFLDRKRIFIAIFYKKPDYS